LFWTEFGGLIFVSTFLLPTQNRYLWWWTISSRGYPLSSSLCCGNGIVY